MNQQLLAAMCRERRRAIERDYGGSVLLGNGLRISAARVLRAAGEGLFRLGMALDERVTAEPVVETEIV